MSDELLKLNLNYGREGRLALSLLDKRLILHRSAPRPLAEAGLAVRETLQRPVDFPDLRTAFVGGDRVVIVIDVDTPAADVLFQEFWGVLRQSGVAAEDITLIQPAVWRASAGVDPRALLPAAERDGIRLIRHDPLDDRSCAYLASTASGERVYLSRELTDADVVVTIGPAEFDPVLGIRGGGSSLYPGLSDLEAIRKAQGQGHEELGPDDPRPLRQIVDEIGWLLGLQLSVLAIPSGSRGAHRFYAGQTESVLRRARAALREAWLVAPPERAELVLLTVTEDAAGHGWDQVAAAAEAGRRLVERNGRIVVLSQLETLPGPGLEILGSVREPRDALRPIQKAHTPDLLAASRIAAAADWANVSLLSRLDPGVVENLFLTPLGSEDEVRRLLASEPLTTIVESAQHVLVQTGS